MPHPRVRLVLLVICTLVGVGLLAVWIRSELAVRDQVYFSTSGEFALSGYHDVVGELTPGNRVTLRGATFSHPGPNYYVFASRDGNLSFTRITQPTGLGLGIWDTMRVRLGRRLVLMSEQTPPRAWTDHFRRPFSLAQWGYGGFLFGYGASVSLPSQTQPILMANGYSEWNVTLPLPLLVLVAFAPLIITLWRRRRKSRVRGFDVGAEPVPDADDSVDGPPAAAWPSPSRAASRPGLGRAT